MLAHSFNFFRFEVFIVKSYKIKLHTRPDILHSVTWVARQLHKATLETAVEVNRIFKYLKRNPELGVVLDASGPLSIRAFSDADWAGHKATRKSTSGVVIFLGKSSICWSSKSQKSVSLSSMESELIAPAAACQGAMQLENLLSELLPSQNLT